MLKKILKLNGVQKLNRYNQKTVLGGVTGEYTCWNITDPDPGSSFQSGSDASSGTIDCVYNSIGSIPEVLGKSN